MRSLIFVTFLLAGCASTGDIYESAVDETAHIDKPIGVVSQCMQLRMSEAPITTPDGQTTFLVKNGYGLTMGMITLVAKDGGTDVAVRRTQGMVSTGMWKHCR